MRSVVCGRPGVYFAKVHNRCITGMRRGVIDDHTRVKIGVTIDDSDAANAVMRACMDIKEQTIVSPACRVCAADSGLWDRVLRDDAAKSCLGAAPLVRREMNRRRVQDAVQEGFRGVAEMETRNVREYENDVFRQLINQKGQLKTNLGAYLGAGRTFVLQWDGRTHYHDDGGALSRLADAVWSQAENVANGGKDPWDEDGD